MNGPLKFLGLVVCASTLALPCASAQSEAFVKQRAAARTELVRGLLELATWCESKQLFLERDRTYAQVLAVDADNAAARKGLRHRRGPDGAWEVPSPTKPANRDPKALLEIPTKRAAVIVPFCDTLLELVDGANGETSQRPNVYDEILALDPEEARVHELRGDVKVSDTWFMQETVTCKVQREKIKAVVKTSLAEAAKGVRTDATAEEQKLVGSWRCALATDAVRVLSTGDDEGCERMLQVVQTAGALIEGLLGPSVSYPGQYTIYMLGPDEKTTFIERLPDVTSKDRTMMMGTVGGGIPSTANVAIWDADPKLRLDLAVRSTYSTLIRNVYGIPSDSFASEGLGLYLTREILGTRLTWWVIPAKAPRGEFFAEAAVTQDLEAQATRARLMQAESNWLNEALKLYDAGAAPHLAQVTRRRLDAMSVADIVVSYALIAYLLEGRPERAHAFFVLVGSDGAEAAAKSTLDLTLPQLERRMHRWLREVR